MKKSLLALAVAAVAASSVASAATVYDKDGTSLAVYGRVQAVVYSQHAGDAVKTANSGDSSLVGTGRLGFDMRTQLTDGIAGFAKAEWDMDDGDKYKDGFDSRYLWVGADFGAFGQLKAGRFEDAVKYVLNTTDIFDDWGCNGQAGNDDKRDGMFMYSWSGWGFDANISYQTSKKEQQVDGAYFTNDNAYEKLDIEGAVAASVGYTSPDVLFGPIAIRLGYGYTEFSTHGDGNNVATDKLSGYDYDSYNQYAAALSWGNLSQGLYVAGLWQTRNFDLKADDKTADYDVQGAEFVVSYGFANGVAIRTGYEWQNVELSGVSSAADFDVDAQTIPVYVNYQINPNFNIWVEARFDVGTDDDEIATGVLKSGKIDSFQENVYSVGARYTF